MALFSTSFILPNNRKEKKSITIFNMIADVLQNTRVSPMPVIAGAIFSKIVKIPLQHSIPLITFYSLSGCYIIHKTNNNVLITKEKEEYGTKYSVKL